MFILPPVFSATAATNFWAAISWLLFGGVVVAKVRLPSPAAAQSEPATTSNMEMNEKNATQKIFKCFILSSFNRIPWSLLY